MERELKRQKRNEYYRVKRLNEEGGGSGARFLSGFKTRSESTSPKSQRTKGLFIFITCIDFTLLELNLYLYYL